MTQHEENVQLIELVAARLANLDVPLAFVGGITTSLYLDDAFAGAARGTDDVDCVVEITTSLQMARLEKRLRQSGLSNDRSVGAPVCRWVCSGVKVDVMPVVGEILGFTNPWYADGVRRAQKL